MKDQIMLGEKEFLKAVLIILILMMTFVCLHVFILKSDAAEIPKVQMKNTAVLELDTFAPAEGLETLTCDAGTK